MTTTDSRDSSSTLMDIAFGYVKTESIIAAYELGVFEVLAKHGAMTFKDLAKVIEVPDDHLEKLLNFLVTETLLDKETQAGGKEVFNVNTVSKKHFIKESQEPGAVYLGDWIPFLKEFLPPHGTIMKAVQAGKQQRTKERNVYDSFEKQQEIRRIFQAGMTVVAKTAVPLTTAFDLSPFKSYVDLGGGTGLFARAMADQYPNMDVSVCDLPNVMKTAATLPDNKETRVKFVPGDFFVDELPKADLYSVNHVLHNWNDDSCDKILAAVEKAVNPGGSLMILETIYNNDKIGPSKNNLTEMTQVFHHEGTHRSLEEYTELMARHGFKDVQVFRYKGFGFYDGLLAKKM